jgi:hypothetical protein
MTSPPVAERAPVEIDVLRAVAVEQAARLVVGVAPRERAWPRAVAYR